MTVDRTRFVGLMVVVVGIGALAAVACFDAQPTLDGQQALAKRGDPGAQFGVGYGYWVGQSGQEEDAEAGHWFRLAAEQGHADAQFQLGTLHLKIADGRQAAEAARWYRVAAEQGHADAQYNLGDMHAYGYGVHRDDTEAIRWYRLAADQGNAGAQVSLGFMYAKHILEEPPRLPRRANAATPAGAATEYWRGPGPQDDARFRRGVMNRYRLEAEQGHAAAQFYVGAIYRRGQVVPRDETEAARWFRLAAVQGHGDAQFTLGDMYETGRGVRQDDVEAHLWLSLAARSFEHQEDRDRSVKARDALAQQMTTNQIATAHRRARRWTPRPAL
jgi:TPR repeat protein